MRKNTTHREWEREKSRRPIINTQMYILYIMRWRNCGPNNKLIHRQYTASFQSEMRKESKPNINSVCEIERIKSGKNTQIYVYEIGGKLNIHLFVVFYSSSSCHRFVLPIQRAQKKMKMKTLPMPMREYRMVWIEVFHNQIKIIVFIPIFFVPWPRNEEQQGRGRAGKEVVL